MSKDLLQEIDRLRGNFSKYTRKAFRMLPRLKRPRILDIGCGSGVPTIELAKLSDGEVIGIDIDQSSLDELNRKIEEEGFSNKVKALNLSLFKMDFPDESFDIIWAEGVMRIMGFEKSLKEWNRLLKLHGFLVVHDAIDIVADKLEKISGWGYRLTNHFKLSKDAWWRRYYKPLETQIEKIDAVDRDKLKAVQTLKKYQNEIDIFKRNPEEQRSAFYILQKLENLTALSR